VTPPRATGGLASCQTYFRSPCPLEVSGRDRMASKELAYDASWVSIKDHNLLTVTTV